jgi:hypothetical protein
MLSSSTLRRGALFVRCLPAALGLFAALVAPGAFASVVYNPSSIVDHGSYITDTVNQRDWYKFSNAANTKGLAFEAAMSQFAALGWSGASITQVQGLQGQFGWTADTLSISANDNYGLTSAMSDYLGYTAQFFVGSDAGVGTYFDYIDAVTTDQFFFNGSNVPYRIVTESRMERIRDERGNTILFGDYVDGVHDVQAFNDPAPNGLNAVWLTRDTALVGNVPEPASWALVAVGLSALFMRNRARRVRV